MKIDRVEEFNKYNYDVSRTCDDWYDNMHHIHNSCEFLFVEEGAATYYIDGRAYYVEAGDVLIIEAMHHHRRVIDKIPFKRYGLTIKPTYYKGLMLDDDLMKVFKAPSVEYFNENCKAIAPEVFDELVFLLKRLREEQKQSEPFGANMERALIVQLSILLFRAFGLKQDKRPLTSIQATMVEIKEYISTNYAEALTLKTLSEKFFRHPATISKEFNKYCDQSLNKYINAARISASTKMLENTNDSIGEIAGRCGFESENTFLRQFKGIMEMSPTSYRKTFRELRREANNEKGKTNNNKES